MKKRAKKKQEASPVTIKGEVPTSPAVNNYEPSNPIPPEIAFQEAEQELDRDFFRGYLSTINVLRQKGFSYREIAEWLTERGVEVDHNVVYRAYRSWAEAQGMTEQDANEDDYRSSLEEKEGR
jgi:hypothetical protein